MGSMEALTGEITKLCMIKYQVSSLTPISFRMIADLLSLIEGGKMMKKFGIVLLAACWLMFGCAKNFTQFIDRELSPDLLNKKLETEIIDLSKNGQCPGTLQLQIVNVEQRTDKYKLRNHPTGAWYVKPKEFIDRVAVYIEAKLVESKIEVVRKQGKQILISMEDIKAEDAKGGWSVRAIAKLRIQIPQINYERIYSGEEQSPMGNYAVAYAVGIAVQQFLQDPIFQKYVHCRSEM
jgi:hypothetical protein